MAELGKPVVSAALAAKEKQRLAQTLTSAVVQQEVPTEEPVAKPKRTRKKVVD
jgi:hypothetical protein